MDFLLKVLERNRADTGFGVNAGHVRGGEGGDKSASGRGLAGGMTGLGEPREVGATSGNAGPLGNRQGALGKEKGGNGDFGQVDKDVHRPFKYQE